MNPIEYFLVVVMNLLKVGERRKEKRNEQGGYD